jgi:Co/Zn/Cd efflux system component
MALLIPAASALGLLVESDRSISVTDLTIAVIIGAISLTLNLWGLIATRRRHHLLRLGVLAHFVEDSIGSIVVIVTSSLAYVYQTPRYNWIGSLIIIGVTLSVGVIAALHTAIKIGHREPRHDHLSEPTEEHELHSPTATS